MGKLESNKIGEKLKELRIAHNLKQIDIAAAIDVKQATYSQYETGKRTPSSLILYKISSFYGLSVDDLLHLCVDLDDNIFFDAKSPSPSGIETYEFLRFSKIKRYASLSQQERRLLFYFSKLNELKQNEIIDFASFKYTKSTRRGLSG